MFCIILWFIFWCKVGPAKLQSVCFRDLHDQMYYYAALSSLSADIITGGSASHELIMNQRTWCCLDWWPGDVRVTTDQLRSLLANIVGYWRQFDNRRHGTKWLWRCPCGQVNMAGKDKRQELSWASGRECNTIAPMPNHYCTDSGSKWHRQRRIEKPIWNRSGKHSVALMARYPSVYAKD